MLGEVSERIVKVSWFWESATSCLVITAENILVFDEWDNI